MGFFGFVLCMKYETTRDGVIFHPAISGFDTRNEAPGKGWELCEVKSLR